MADDDKADLIQRIRDSVPLVVVGPMVTTGCDCPSLPVNYWHLPDGSWLNHGPVVPAEAEADAAEFSQLNCTGWVMACPECGHVYVSGVA